MQQFKTCFEGKHDPEEVFGGRRLASVQKSFRTTDIEEVGDKDHLTFFEMLGNFSVGSYFKERAIALADEFIRDVLEIPVERVHITVFEGNKNVPRDEDSAEFWRQLGYTEQAISWQDAEENFWGPTGDEGPCGPTTEIYVDGLEVWNLVFNEYYCHQDGSLENLSEAGGNQGVDTGMGLERLVLIMQGVESIFETDLFAPLLREVQERAPQADVASLRIIADHMRASVFLIGDGVRPSNQKQGYILRRLIRRLYRKAKEYNGSAKESLLEVLECVIDQYSSHYSGLLDQRGSIREVFEEEVNKFDKTLEKGVNKFKKLVNNYDKIVPGQDAFFLYESFGFPVEFIQELAQEYDLEVDIEGFRGALEEHKEKSRG